VDSFEAHDLEEHFDEEDSAEEMSRDTQREVKGVGVGGPRRSVGGQAHGDGIGHDRNHYSVVELFARDKSLLPPNC
jgi:hypothetical protein